MDASSRCIFYQCLYVGSDSCRKASHPVPPFLTNRSPMPSTWHTIYHLALSQKHQPSTMPSLVAFNSLCLCSLLPWSRFSSVNSAHNPPCLSELPFKQPALLVPRSRAASGTCIYHKESFLASALGLFLCLVRPSSRNGSRKGGVLRPVYHQRALVLAASYFPLVSKL